MDKDIINFIITEKMGHLNRIVSHYKDSYLPDIYEYTGGNQQQHLESAKENLQRFKVNVNDFRETENFILLGITKTEQANYLRLYAIEQREQAEDWKGCNVFIYIRSLRNCIKAIQLLKGLYPELEIYSNKFLSSRNKINLAL